MLRFLVNITSPHPVGSKNNEKHVTQLPLYEKDLNFDDFSQKCLFRANFNVAQGPTFEKYEKSFTLICFPTSYDLPTVCFEEWLPWKNSVLLEIY